MKGLFIPDITSEMFRNGCLEGIEALMAEGEIYDIECDPSAQRWIPVTERLPEKPGQYYVSGGDKVWICEFLIIATTNIPNFIGGWCNDVANPVVQAWMPLPEPYREDTP